MPQRHLIDPFRLLIASIRALTGSDVALAARKHWLTARIRALTAGICTVIARNSALTAGRPGAPTAPGTRSCSRNGARRTLETAHEFLREGKGLEDRFVKAGLPGTLLTELQGMVEALERAIAAKQQGRKGLNAANTGRREAMKAASAIVRTLDLVVPITLKPTPELLVLWKAARRVTRRGGGTRVEAEPVEAPAETGEATSDAELKAS